MPTNEKYLAAFEEDCTYHVYNRTNNKELLFRSDENREFFLQQFSNYLNPFVEVFCYCLLPNHFHFMIRVKSATSIKDYLQSLPDKELKGIHKIYLADPEVTPLAEHNPELKVSPLTPTIHDLIEYQFHRFFTSYAMAFNRRFNRTGNLFQRSFKRVQIEKDNQFTQTIIYIHANPLKHKITNDFTVYPWSSYGSIIAQSEVSPLAKERGSAKGDTSFVGPAAAKELVDWFGNTDRFIRDHKELSQFYRDVDSYIED
jgi:REP element-mobilizing transposase RayT